MDYSDYTAEQLVDELMDTLSNWDRHGDYYLGTLIPRIVAGEDMRGSAVQDIADELRRHLGADGLNRLPEMVASRLGGVMTAPLPPADPPMRCPQPGDFNEALQFPGIALTDPELSAGEVTTNAMGLPRVMSGNFALTYSITTGWNRYAVRCFHKSSPGLQARYGAISQELAGLDAPYFLKFEFQPQGIRIGGGTFPIVKMQWGDGETLGEFLETRHGRAGNVNKLRSSLRTLAGYLDDRPLAHGDVQPGNVMVSRAGGTVQLIDYDGMYVDALRQAGSSELGHAAFQHARRKSEHWDARLDRFSFIVLDVALRALEEDPSLWDKTGSSGDSILFTPGDYVDPRRSTIFRELCSRPSIGPDAQRLAAVCLGPFDAVPGLGEFVSGAGVPREVIVEPSSTFEPLPYTSALPVVDATDYEECLAREGERVQLVGRVVSVKDGTTKYGEPYVFLDFGDWREDIVHVSLWSEGLAALEHKPDESWVGKWVSIIGLVEPPYRSEKFGYSHVAVSVFQHGQIHELDKSQAEFRLRDHNQDVLRRMKEMR